MKPILLEGQRLEKWEGWVLHFKTQLEHDIPIIGGQWVVMSWYILDIMNVKIKGMGHEPPNLRNLMDNYTCKLDCKNGLQEGDDKETLGKVYLVIILTSECESRSANVELRCGEEWQGGNTWSQ